MPKVVRGVPFVLLLWALSRSLVILTVWLSGSSPTAEANGVMQTGWQLFTHWDGLGYQRIATTGYTLDDTGQLTIAAFFPLFPLLAKGLMQVGLPFSLAGVLINNLAFLGALLLLYCWMEERHSRTIARWTIATLVWLPFSLFCSVTYTEGLFLLCSIATMRAFDRQQYVQTAVWGALATATRPTGIALIAALLFTAWREKRPIQAYGSGLGTAIGVLCFSIFCWWRFGNPLAFLQAQQHWRSASTGWQGWQKLFTQVFLGTVDWSTLTLKTPWHPVILVGLFAIAILLWRFRLKLGVMSHYGGMIGVLILWLVVGDPLVNLLMVVGSGFLLWQFRSELRPIVLVYGSFGLLMLILSGSTISLGRIAYGIAPVPIAVGFLMAKTPHWNYSTIGLWMILLLSFSARFGQLLWAG